MDDLVHILVLTPTLECGGAERYVSIIAEHLDPSKFQITIGVVDNSRPFYQVSADKADVIDLQCKRVSRSVAPIARLVRKIKPDIIYSTANHLNLLLAIFRRRIAGDIPLVFRESSVVSINSDHARFPFLYKNLLKAFYQRADMIVCQSAFMQADLVRMTGIPEENTIVIHNPVEEKKFEPTAGQQDAPAITRLLSVGRLSKEKGFDRIIHALSMLSIPFTYEIYGEGSERESLEKLIAEANLSGRVFLRGNSSTPFAGAGSADLFLLGSRYEGFPNVLLEAGVHGLPAIAFQSPGGTAEIIEQGKTGFLIPDGDLQAFAQGIEKAAVLHFDRAYIHASTLQRFSVQKHLSVLEPLLLRMGSRRF